jgi:hypothetical protein
MSAIDGRFEITRVLGAGTMGDAVLARDPDGQAVVVKLLKKTLTQASDFQERFRREIRALEKLRHPHIVSLLSHGFCAERGQPYYVMEFCPGAGLDEIVTAHGGHIPVARALGLMEQVLDGLAFAHEHGVVHRDVKPANLLIVQPGSDAESARILDFGLAKHLVGGSRTVEPLTGPGQMIGTPLYMAPELFVGDPALPGTDVYAVGCILMEIMTGAPPFPGDQMRNLIRQHLSEPPPRLDSRRNAPRELSDLLDQCLAKTPAERPGAHELRERLAAVRAHLRTPTARHEHEVVAAAPAVPEARGPSDVPRAKLEIRHGGEIDRILLFAGASLRFGRATELDGKRTCDLVLRSFPRPGEAAEAATQRSLGVSRWHGTIFLTEDQAAVRDEGSTAHTFLDGAAIPAATLVPLPQAFGLDVGTAVSLRGRVLKSPAGPLAALVFERPAVGRHDHYVLVRRDVSLGSGEDDGVRLRYPGVAPGHARLAFLGGRFAIATGPAAESGRPLPLAAYEPLEPGRRIRLGSVEAVFGLATDDDMKPD